MDDTVQPAADDAAPVDTAKIQCITDLRPWALVMSDLSPATRPLLLDEVATIPRDKALDAMKRNRHVVEIR